MSCGRTYMRQDKRRKHGFTETSLPVLSAKERKNGYTSRIFTGYGNAGADLLFYPVGNNNCKHKYQKLCWDTLPLMQST